MKLKALCILVAVLIAFSVSINNAEARGSRGSKGGRAGVRSWSNSRRIGTGSRKTGTTRAPRKTTHKIIK